MIIPKTAGFIREEEIVNMKKAVLGAKEVLTEKTGAREMISLDGSICRCV